MRNEQKHLRSIFDDAFHLITRIFQLQQNILSKEIKIAKEGKKINTINDDDVNLLLCCVL